MTRDTHLTAPRQEKVLLVALVFHGHSRLEAEVYLDELASLAFTRGYDVAGRFIQVLSKPNPSTWIGKGKVEEIRQYIKAKKIDKVIFDDELSASQNKNLFKAWQKPVLDRSLLILDIFAMRARTAQAKTQVELAQYLYMKTHLTRMWTHLSRQKGGNTGMRGPGEKELETDRRIVDRKIFLLKEKLDKIETQETMKRQQRDKYANIALVGYTNAGKSSLMHALSKEHVLVEDKLFATLGTTVRKVVIENIPFLLSDTVGFIRKLPHTLVESFKSTLAEARSADLLLHVVDGAQKDYMQHIEIVQQTLSEIGAKQIPQLIVLNKSDLIWEKNKKEAQLIGKDKQHFLSDIEKELTEHTGYPVVACSALNKQTLLQLKTVLHNQMAPIHYTIYPNKAPLPEEE